MEFWIIAVDAKDIWFITDGIEGVFSPKSNKAARLRPVDLSNNSVISGNFFYRSISRNLKRRLYADEGVRIKLHWRSRTVGGSELFGRKAIKNSINWKWKDLDLLTNTKQKFATQKDIIRASLETQTSLVIKFNVLYIMPGLRSRQC